MSARLIIGRRRHPARLGRRLRRQYGLLRRSGLLPENAGVLPVIF
jgi:hypothetical protein